MRLVIFHSFLNAEYMSGFQIVPSRHNFEKFAIKVANLFAGFVFVSTSKNYMKWLISLCTEKNDYINKMVECILMLVKTKQSFFYRERILMFCN